VFVPMVIGMIVYFALTYVIGAKPIREFLSPILRKGARE